MTINQAISVFGFFLSHGKTSFLVFVFPNGKHASALRVPALSPSPWKTCMKILLLAHVVCFERIWRSPHNRYAHIQCQEHASEEGRCQTWCPALSTSKMNMACKYGSCRRTNIKLSSDKEGKSNWRDNFGAGEVEQFVM